MKTILITGVAGLLGSRLADWIIENHPEYKVVGIDDLSGGYKENINSKVDFWEVNLINPKHRIDLCFEENKFDYVFHFAAYAAEGLSPFIRQYNYDNNLKATARIVNECIKHDVKRLVFTSTLAVYGHGYGGIFDEAQIPKPIDPYGVAKYACEMDIQIAGEQTRAFSYIDDNLEPFWNAAVLPQASKEIINVGGIEEISILEASSTLREIIGEGNIIFKEARHEVKHSIPTWQKSVDILNYQYKTSLKDGLTQMWNWAQTQPKHDRFVWSSYELEKGIYSFWKK